MTSQVLVATDLDRTLIYSRVAAGVVSPEDWYRSSTWMGERSRS